MAEQKKTVFATGLFPDKNRNLLENLCRHFRVIMLKQQAFPAAEGSLAEFAENVLAEEELQTDGQLFMWEFHKCIKFTEQKLADLFPEENSLSKDEFESFLKTARTASWMAHIFKRLAEKIQIDMVVTNADYSVFRRPIVVEAKRLGIPTLDIEHGFFAMSPEPSVLVEESRGPSLLFLSDFVNVDNQIEKELWGKYQKIGFNKNVKFLALGTPNDKSDGTTISKQEALHFLKLEPQKLTITLAGTWIEARYSSTAIASQLEHVEFFNGVLAALKKINANREIQVIIKLHPAHSEKQVFHDAETYFKKYAESIGVKISLVTCQDLNHVLAASDLIICPHLSSVLWEGFLASVPGVVYPLPSFFFKTYQKEKLNESNPLFRKGLLKFVFSEQELIDSVDHYLQPENYQKYQQASEKLRCEKQIKNESADIKSRRICKWIQDFVDEETPEVEVVDLTSNYEDDRINLFFEMGSKLIQDGKIKEGLEMLSQILERKPAHKETLQLMGDVFLQLGYESKAQEMWRLAKAKSPVKK